jgi:hypothetical protein
MPTSVIVFAVVVVVVFLVATSTVKIVQEYERGVIFRLGRLVGARGPGLFLLIPCVERMRKVDLRIVTLEVPAQEAITRDNVTVKVWRCPRWLAAATAATPVAPSRARRRRPDRQGLNAGGGSHDRTVDVPAGPVG